MQKARHHRIVSALTACRRTVSGTLSLPCSGCFSPFPHGTCSLSVSGEYLALADGPAGFTRGSTCPALLRIPLCFRWLRVRGCHPLRRAFPDASARHLLAVPRSYNPARAGTRAVWAVPRSLATTGGITFCFLFLRVLRCFSSPRSPPPISGGCPRCTRTGCPIQEPVDLRPLASPHGFSQLAAPFIAFLSHRHPPCALSCFRPPALLSAGAYLGCLFFCLLVESRFLSSLLFHHVNELLRRGDVSCLSRSGFGWRITDSNR